MSTDPAHSLGDAVKKDLTSTPIRIADGLDAVEVDADGAMASGGKPSRPSTPSPSPEGTGL